MGRTYAAGSTTAADSVPAVEVRERFAELMARPEQGIDVELPALLIAAAAHAAEPESVTLARLDDIAGGVPAPTLSSLCEHLFVTLGFTGNACDYHDPANSWLDAVIERRTGIPITLSVLLLAVGRRLGLELHGIGMPGHFLVHAPGDDVFIDAFSGGTVLDRQACRRLFAVTCGDGVAFDESMLAPVGPRMIARRMLNNIISIAVAERDLTSRLWAADLRALLPDVSIADRAELASAQAELGRFDDAARTLEVSAMCVPRNEAEGLLRASRVMRARLN